MTHSSNEEENTVSDYYYDRKIARKQRLKHKARFVVEETSKERPITRPRNKNVHYQEHYEE